MHYNNSVFLFNSYITSDFETKKSHRILMGEILVDILDMNCYLLQKFEISSSG